MEQRLKIWMGLISAGMLIGFLITVGMKAARMPELWAWITGISVFLNFFLSGMVGNARGAAQRERETAEFYRIQVQRVEETRSAPQLIITEPPRESRELPTQKAEEIRRQEDERKYAGFTQSYMNPSPTPPPGVYYRDPMTGEYRKAR